MKQKVPDTVTFLLINTNCSFNKGSAAQVESTVAALRRFIPNARFSFISRYPELDAAGCVKLGIKMVAYHSKGQRDFRQASVAFLYHSAFSLLRCVLWRVLNSIGISVSHILNEAYCLEYIDADIVIDLSGDGFSDRGARSPLGMLGIIMALVLRKSLIFYSQSIGPFTKLMMPIAKLCLNKAHLITVREEISNKYLETIGINETPVYQVADCAFTLNAITPEKAIQILAEAGDVNDGRPLVGISVSVLIAELADRNTAKHRHAENDNNRYLCLIASLVDFLIEKMQTKVVLIPHLIAPSYWLQDDRSACLGVYQLVKNKDKVGLLTQDYTPGELKGVIGQCDLFVGSRMHANIAALSSCVPTVALGWSHKYKGIMEKLGIGQYVCDFGTVTTSDLISMVTEAWTNREIIKRLLAGNIAEEKESALYSAKLVKDLVDSLEAK